MTELRQNAEIGLAGEVPMAPNRLITGFFQKLWGQKMNFVTEKTFKEKDAIIHQRINHWQRLAQGITSTDNTDGEVEKAVGSLVLGFFENNQEKIGDKISASFDFKLPGEESVAGKIWTGNFNCIQQAMIARDLIKEKCGEETEIIYSFGGRAPWLHSALKTKHGYIVYGKGFMTPSEFKGYYQEYQKDLGKAIIMPKNLRKKFP
ncbi:MAG: hypothetical protein AAB430_03430 [Patescibacteria group bacterium]